MNDLEYRKSSRQSNPIARLSSLTTAGALLLVAALSVLAAARLISGIDLNGYLGDTFVPLRAATLLALVAVGAAVAAVGSLRNDSHRPHQRRKAPPAGAEELDIFNVRSNSKVA